MERAERIRPSVGVARHTKRQERRPGGTNSGSWVAHPASRTEGRAGLGGSLYTIWPNAISPEAAVPSVCIGKVVAKLPAVPSMLM